MLKGKAKIKSDLSIYRTLEFWRPPSQMATLMVACLPEAHYPGSNPGWDGSRTTARLFRAFYFSFALLAFYSRL